jgi:hypothetical protein
MTIRATGSVGGVVGAGRCAISGSNGPFYIGGWVRQVASAPSQKYLFWTGDTINTNQTAILWGYLAGNIEFFTLGGSGTAPRAGSGIPISDNAWHHVAYRKDTTGSGSWNKFLDGVKTEINSNINFTLPSDQKGLSILCGETMTGFVPNCEVHEWACVPYRVPDSDIVAMSRGIPFGRLSAGYASGNYWSFDGVHKFNDKMGAINLRYNTNLDATNPPLMEAERMVYVEYSQGGVRKRHSMSGGLVSMGGF